MKTIRSLLLMILLCYTHGLQAQMYFFDANESYVDVDSEGNDLFGKKNFKLVIDGKKNEGFLTSEDTNAVIWKEAFQGDPYVKKTPESTEYVFGFGAMSSLVLLDYKDPAKQDVLNIYDLAAEMHHYQGKFNLLVLDK
ncbi:hypothetical protein [Chryseobacterium sp. A321]